MNELSEKASEWYAISPKEQSNSTTGKPLVLPGRLLMFDTRI
jgi:hypothetical protein